MALTNSQIERYSRQIIVPKVGGVGQERLLASRLMIAGDLVDVEPVLAYMVGAGVGTIFLRVPGDASLLARLIAAMRELNSDVAVKAVNDIPDSLSLVLALASTSVALDSMQALCTVRWIAPMIVARLDAQASVVLMPSRPPCPLCAEGELLAPLAIREENAGFVAMFAAVEALKILVQYAPAPEPVMIEFNGYESKPRPLRVRAGSLACACGVTR